MVTGKVYFIHSGTDNDNIFASDQEYYDRMGAAINAAYDSTNVGGYLDAYLVSKDSSTIANLNITIHPAIAVSLDNFPSKVFFITGIRTDEYLKNWFTNLFKGNTTGSGVVTDGESGFGTDIKLFDRDCNPLDRFLDFIKIGQIKRGVYGVGALYLAYKAFTIPNTAGVAISGGMSAALAYLALGSPQSACAGALTFEKDAKIILSGAGIALLFGGVWYVYLKDEIANRRLVRLVGAATGQRNTSASKTTSARPRTRRTNRPKSVTRTVRY